MRHEQLPLFLVSEHVLLDTSYLRCLTGQVIFFRRNENGSTKHEQALLFMLAIFKRKLQATVLEHYKEKVWFNC